MSHSLKMPSGLQCWAIPRNTAASPAPCGSLSSQNKTLYEEFCFKKHSAPNLLSNQATKRLKYHQKEHQGADGHEHEIAMWHDDLRPCKFIVTHLCMSSSDST
eukprot:1709042-Amphidinium_carterae.1